MNQLTGLHAVDGVLIAPAPSGFDDQEFATFKQGVLAALHDSSLRGAVIDASRVELLDSATFGVLADTARMARLLGAGVIFVGFGPGIVSALIDMDVDLDGILCAPDLEDALAMLRGPGADATDGETDPGEAMAEDAGALAETDAADAQQADQ